MALTLFVYGTLLDEDVFDLVVGRPSRALWQRPATAWGYRRVRLPKESYPLLIPGDHPEARVEGRVVRGLSDEEQARVVFFEDFEYRLVPIEVIIDGEGEAQAAVFGPGTRCGAPAKVHPWSLATWQAQHKAPFMALARRYMALFGQVSNAEADRYWLQWSEEAQ
ncbi:MAG: gamma-glutamylcyclotransferase family protein [Candidatus Competibacterales bacterium]